jgi:4-amino-4-deoxy-L-arabinose transferase-like glycosyltransferase
MKKLLLLFFTLIIPLSFLYCWKLKNNQYPKNDESFYFGLTQKLYVEFNHKSTAEAIQNVYYFKNFKPILHPILAIPVLALTDGDARLTIAIYTSIIYTILLLICYLFLSRHLKQTAAAIGTIFIAFIPWIFGLQASFNSEITFVTATLGLFYSVYDQTNFKNLKNSLLAGASLSLMICLRPVETAMIGGLPVIIFIIYNYIKKEVSFNDLILLLI